MTEHEIYVLYWFYLDCPDLHKSFQWRILERIKIHMRPYPCYVLWNSSCEMKPKWTQIGLPSFLVQIERSDKMRTLLIVLQLTIIFPSSKSCSVLSRNKTESFRKLNLGSNPSSYESLSSANATLLFTYTIHRYPTNPDTNLSAEVIDEIIENAFSLWSSVSPIQFSRVDSNQHADIQLSFERGVHLQGRGRKMFHNDMINET